MNENLKCLYCSKDLSRRKRDTKYCNWECKTLYKREEIENKLPEALYESLTPEQKQVYRWQKVYQNSSFNAMLELAGLKTGLPKQAEACVELFALKRG